MAATQKSVLITLESIKWTGLTVVSGGGGVHETPSVSPYLWTVFFKIDGTTAMIADTYYLIGTATVEDAQGKHGDLGIWSMSVGDTVSIPDALGFWSTTLMPIPIDPAAQAFFNLPGVPTPEATFGCVAILLDDGGHIPAHAVEAGRKALTSSLQAFLNSELNNKLGVAQPKVPPGDLARGQKDISDAITNAMKNSLSFLEKLWAVSGSDQSIASWTIISDAGQISSLQVSTAGTAASPLGTWDLAFGITITDPCPAEAAVTVIEGLLSQAGGSSESAAKHRTEWAAEPLQAMRAFRDNGSLRDRPGLRSWWNTARENTPETMRIIAGDARLVRAAETIMTGTSAALKSSTEPLDKPVLDAILMLLMTLEERGSTTLKIAAANARRVLEVHAGRSLDTLLDRLASDQRRRK